MVNKYFFYVFMIIIFSLGYGFMEAVETKKTKACLVDGDCKDEKDESVVCYKKECKSTSDVHFCGLIKSCPSGFVCRGKNISLYSNICYEKDEAGKEGTKCSKDADCLKDLKCLQVNDYKYCLIEKSCSLKCEKGHSCNPATGKCE